ncbi:MAG TPA: bpX6 domain-containing protein, partial [Burkholderiaceae bacterium]
MNPNTPLRTPVLDGHRRIDALWFPAGWFDEERRRDELLGAWRRGCTAHRFDEGDLLRWPNGVPQDCGALGGWPLQRIGTTLCSAAIAPSTVAEQAADVLLVVGARLRALRWSQGQPLDPSGWIAVDGFPLSDAYDFRLPPPTRAMVITAPRDIRAVLGNAIPDPDAKAQALLQALNHRTGAAADARRSEGMPAAARAPASRSGARTWLPWAAAAISALSVLSHLMQLSQTPKAPYSNASLPVLSSPPPATLLRNDAEPASPWAGQILASPRDVTGSAFPAQARSTGGTSVRGINDAAPPRVPTPDADARVPVSPNDETPSSVPESPPPLRASTTAPESGLSEGIPLGFEIIAGMGLALVFAVWVGLIVRAATSGLGGIPEPARQSGQASESNAGSKTDGEAAAGGMRVGKGSFAAGLRARAERLLPQRWRAWLARLAMTSGVADLIGRQHAAYVRRMLALFEHGDLDAALRHALPLGSGQNSLGQALGRLAPQRELALGRQPGAGTRVGIGDKLEQHLRALYRRTFEQLDHAGRIDEATYVLAELLAQRGEALDYLEKHARHAQAAELALAWDMPAARIVRLMARAGDWRRAVLVAERDDAFAAAVAQLEPRWPDAATRLRREWARRLAASGRLLAAVQAIWPIETERASALGW